MGLWNFFSKSKTVTPSTKKRDKPEQNTPLKKDRIGEIEGYFRKVKAAVIKIKKGPLKMNDRIWIKGYTTDLKLTIKSLEINRKTVQSAKKGQSVGVQVKKRVRRGDGVYRISS